KSGGVGIDLTRARYAVYYSLDFSLADAMQSRKRLHRPGQPHRVTYIHLLAESTVDRAIYGAVRRRQDADAAVPDRLQPRPPPHRPARPTTAALHHASRRLRARRHHRDPGGHRARP